MILEYLPESAGVYRYNYCLRPLTWFKIGGAAEVFFKPDNQCSLQRFLAEVPYHIPIAVIGACSNTLVSDDGVKGIVIKLGKAFTQIKLSEDGDHLIVGAGSLNHSVLEFCRLHAFAGLEFMAGIPGTIGGGIAMNAGIGNMEFKDIVHSIRVVNRRGELYNLDAQDIGFHYRGSNLENLIIVEASLKWHRGNTQAIIEQIESLKAQRLRTQPIKAKTCGCVFINPPQISAWQLIDQVGLRGYRIGGAQFSTLHCNFIENIEHASSHDVEELVALAQSKALENFGINLKWEIKKIGGK